MESIKKLLFVLFTSLFCVSGVFALSEQIRVDLIEEVNQKVIYNPLAGVSSGIWSGPNENQSNYTLKGTIIVSNSNPTETISDIYVSFKNTQNISAPIFFEGRDGTLISSNVSSGLIILHIPELNSNENSTWTYWGDVTTIIPPLNLTTFYSDSKVLAGSNLTITDSLKNEMDNFFASDSCISNITLTQVAVPIDFAGTSYNFYFNNGTAVGGSDGGNVSYSDDQTQTWDVLNGGCLYKNNVTSITYGYNTPGNIPSSNDYILTNTTFSYSINHSLSHLVVQDITAISAAILSIDKSIYAASHPTLYGKNVTWNVTGFFNTDLNISYNLTSVTLWVSQRNVAATSFTDPNTIDNDTISSAPLTINYMPNMIINSTLGWTSPTWFFNYSDMPTPIVWADANFSLTNDGVQLIDRSVSREGNDIYIKELYLIIGYWLEIDKNITAAGSDKYHIEVKVHNKGNQVTPSGSIVTVYDFIPSNFVLNGSFIFQSSPWYTTDVTNNSVIGQYNGTLHQWAITPTLGNLNTSFAQGPTFNENTTWSVNYDVTGSGDYTLLDVFITGLDPQKVDGAGGSTAVIVSEILDRISSTEGIFAAVASVLLLLGFLL
ncbi:MAG: hypothetical protein HRU03_01020 [Nanoarchaeales archaeon]|nr:hypothetical protein [Nanoarchaeales archaeon]